MIKKTRACVLVSGRVQGKGRLIPRYLIVRDAKDATELPVKPQTFSSFLMDIPQRGRREILVGSMASKAIQKSGITVSGLIKVLIYVKEIDAVIWADRHGIYGKHTGPNAQTVRLSGSKAWSLQVYKTQLYYVYTGPIYRCVISNSLKVTKVETWYSSPDGSVNVVLTVYGNVMFWLQNKQGRFKLMQASLPSKEATETGLLKGSKNPFTCLSMVTVSSRLNLVVTGSDLGRGCVISITVTTGEGDISKEVCSRMIHFDESVCSLYI